jgi:hypothetical protein
MKRLLFNVLIIGIVLASMSSCSNKSMSSKSLPPGQQKKIFGSQSAAPFAPGQTKKQAISDAKNVPPGQAKKQTGSTTGKTSAPGQVKKKTPSASN